MTGYYLELGYNSGYGDKEPLWDTLKQEATNLRNDPQQVLRAIIALRGRDYTPLEKECAESLADPEQLACSIVEPEGEEKGFIALLASGGNPGRTAKEETRRAFCRLLIARMHARGIEVNLRVS